MLEDLDRQVSLTSETIARTLSRRRVLVNSVKGLVATVAGVTLAQLTNIKRAFAFVCCGGVDCYSTYGLVCPSQRGCPSSCTVCTNADCSSYCLYSSGFWTCGGQGTCGNGFRYCTDCKCPDCSKKCTCESQCICCGCCTPHDVEAEMRRLAAAGVA